LCDPHPAGRKKKEKQKRCRSLLFSSPRRGGSSSLQKRFHEEREEEGRVTKHASKLLKIKYLSFRRDRRGEGIIALTRPFMKKVRYHKRKGGVKKDEPSLPLSAAGGGEKEGRGPSVPSAGIRKKKKRRRPCPSSPPSPSLRNRT